MSGIEWLTKALSEQGIELTEQQQQQFQTYYRLLVEWNEKMNLTSITDEHEVYLKHFYDSITAGFYYDFNQPLTLCDVGAGAGFPSIPLKIVFPELKVTIVDSLNKRIQFLNHLIQPNHNFELATHWCNRCCWCSYENHLCRKALQGSYDCLRTCG